MFVKKQNKLTNTKLTMFFKSLFSRKTIRINGTHRGSHGEQWFACFGHKNFDEKNKVIDDLTKKILEEEKNTAYSGKYSVRNLNMGEIDFVAIVDGEQAVSLFPHLKSEIELPFVIKKITEWKHLDNIEAQIGGSGRNEFGLSFFATDYLENKKIYKNNKELIVNLSAFAYGINISNVSMYSEQFSDDYVGYLPKDKQSMEKGEFEFIGKVINFGEFIYENVEGYIITTKLINHPEIEEFFVLDVFVNKDNLEVDELKKGMRIAGTIWLQGNIAENETSL
ncbi:MAG: hypothetical protein ABID64_01455 [Nitrospirota bacterium]